MYIVQWRKLANESTKVPVKSSELGPPTPPSLASLSPPLGSGGEAHSFAGEGVGDPIHTIDGGVQVAPYRRPRQEGLWGQRRQPQSRPRDASDALQYSTYLFYNILLDLGMLQILYSILLIYYTIFYLYILQYYTCIFYNILLI